MQEAGESLPPLQHEDQVSTARFSVDGRMLITASADKTAKIWDTTDGTLKQTLRHTQPLSSASFSRDGLLAATASFDKTTHSRRSML
jgi:WD40 repeat protein